MLRPPRNLEIQLKKGKSAIYSAILKHGLANFKLEILEYCESSEAISREQYNIDLLKPDYNILKIANSRLGSKHTEESLAKIKNAYLNRTEEHKAKMTEHLAKLHASNIGRKHPHTEKSKAKIGAASLNRWQMAEYRAKIIASMEGKTHSEQSKANMSAKKLGIPKSEEHKLKISLSQPNRKSIIVTNLETNVSIEYASIREAAREMNETNVTLGKYLKNSKIFRGVYLIKAKGAM